VEGTEILKCLAHVTGIKPLNSALTVQHGYLSTLTPQVDCNFNWTFI